MATPMNYKTILDKIWLVNVFHHSVNHFKSINSIIEMYKKFEGSQKMSAPLSDNNLDIQNLNMDVFQTLWRIEIYIWEEISLVLIVRLPKLILVFTTNSIVAPFAFSLQSTTTVNELLSNDNAELPYIGKRRSLRTGDFRSEYTSAKYPTTWYSMDAVNGAHAITNAASDSDLSVFSNIGVRIGYSGTRDWYTSVPDVRTFPRHFEHSFG